MKKWESGEETGRSVGTGALILGSEGDTEIELESSPEEVPSGRQGDSNSGDKSGWLAVSWFSPGCV